MVQFGRPLFWTLLDGAAQYEVEIESTIIDTARAKLICHSAIDAKSISETGLTAVLDILLNLDFEPHEALMHEAEMVANHMRTAFSAKAQYLSSGYPSEPILAEAVLQQIHSLQNHQPEANVMANVLLAQFQAGLLDSRLRGEVVCRQLLMEAYRRAVRTDHPEDSPCNFSKGCKLVTFIKELFAENHAELILTSVPDNLKSGTTFAEAFEDAVVRFTHFGKIDIGDDTATTTDAMLAAFIRGMAFISMDSEDVVDLLLPLLLRPTGPLEEPVMSGVLVQVRQRLTGSGTKYEIKQESLGFFPESEDAKDLSRPYVALVADLAVDLPVASAAVTKTKVRAKLAAGPRLMGQLTVTETSNPTMAMLHIPPQSEPISHPRDTHPRYTIFAYGCSDTVYKVIDPASRATYEFLVTNKDFLDEHPRKDENSLDAVRAMKPFWIAGPASYGWIESPFLQRYEVSDVKEEGVVVGRYEDHVDETL